MNDPRGYTIEEAAALLAQLADLFREELEPRGYSIEEAAEILGCKHSFLEKGTYYKKIPFHHYGSVRVFTLKDLREIADKCEIPPEERVDPAQVDRPRIGKRAERRNAA